MNSAPAFSSVHYTVYFLYLESYLKLVRDLYDVLHMFYFMFHALSLGFYFLLIGMDGEDS